MDLTPEQLKALEYESDLILDLELCWQPHPAQQQIKNAVFADGKKLVFLECGRKFGKSEMLIYFLYRFALLNPNSACYFIAPYQKQARELVWSNNRIQNFFMPLVDPKTNVTHKGHNREESHQIWEELNEKYGVRVKDQEMRVIFGNGSFIKLDGADNHQAYRGVNPHIIVYDEFKDHHPKFHVGMDPNLATYDAPLIIVGTPCEGDENNQESFNGIADYADQVDHGAYFNMPTYTNPYISREFLKRKKDELFARNEEDKWFREYMAKRVRSGARNIFPMLDVPDSLSETTTEIKEVTRHIIPEAEIRDRLNYRRREWDFFMAFDPASSTTFAVLLTAINRNTKQVLVMDEIYAVGKAETSSGQIFPKALELLDKWNIMYDDCRMIYDNAAAWFAGEVQSRWDFGLEPCMKDIGKKKEVRLSLIKDMLLLEECLLVSQGCIKFLWEMANYRVDENGRIPKENDHLLDDFRYILSNAYYNQVPTSVPIKDGDGRRGYTFKEDQRADITDPFDHLMGDLYE